VSSFATMEDRPTTNQYLNASLNDVLDRLNTNPSGLQSEEAFVNAVITVRNAMITEKLNKWLIGLTAVVAIATVLLVVAPFFTSSLEAKKLESEIVRIETVNNGLKIEIEALKRELLVSKQAFSALENQVENHNKLLHKDASR